MKRILVLFLIFFIISSCQTSPVREGSVPLAVISGGPENAILLDHEFFLISYSPTEHLPNWVLYRLEAQNVGVKRATRRNKFFPDPLLLAQGLPAVAKKDYDGRKYDRGHLAPSEDFIWDQKANDATFVMTNIVPQKSALNRGSWRALESKVRGWACTEREVRVVAGPVFASDLDVMNSGLVIPRQFFKVVLDDTPPRKAIAFLFNQDDGRVEYSERAVSMGMIERLTGFRFFNDIPEREKIATSFNLKEWKESRCGRFAQELGTTRTDARKRKK